MEDKNKKDSKSNSVDKQRKTDLFKESKFDKKSNKQTNEEIAEQGFTVRDGHNPNKPNPYEKPITNDRSLPKDDNFIIPDDYNLMEGDAHEENERDKDSEK